MPAGGPRRSRFASDRRTPIVKAIANVKDSVVNIHGQKTLGPSDEPIAHGEIPRKVNGMGTGVIFDERGYIITNFHVVDGVQKIEVTLPRCTDHVAQFVASDPLADLAVIKINAAGKLTVITTGTSRDMMVGETVIAVGNAYGYHDTVTGGIVRRLHRSVQVSDSQGYHDLIQTMRRSIPEIGGPLVNVDGEMIGINVAVRAVRKESALPFRSTKRWRWPRGSSALSDSKSIGMESPCKTPPAATPA